MSHYLRSLSDSRCAVMELLPKTDLKHKNRQVHDQCDPRATNEQLHRVPRRVGTMVEPSFYDSTNRQKRKALLIVGNIIQLKPTLSR